MSHLKATAVAVVLLWAAASGAAPRQPANMRPIPIGNPGEWFSPDDYPAAAQRANRQGRVVIDVGIDSAGKAVTCNVLVSSGTTTLDEGTCQLALERGRFNPATDRKGRPTAGSYTMPVRWVLPDSAPRPLLDAAAAAELDGDQTVEYVADAEGKLVSCRVLAGHAPKGAPSDPCTLTPVGQQVTQGFQRDGRAVGARIVRRFSQTVTVDK